MTDFGAMVADLDQQIADESAKIARDIRDAKASGQSVGDGYWHKLHRLEELRRIAAIAARAAAEIMAEARP